MRKLTLIATLLLSSSIALAQYTGSTAPAGGYTGSSSATAATVEQSLTMPDDRYVVLVGNVVSHLGKDKYLFRDKTGEIVIEIDHKKWRDVSVGPEDLVEIQGEVDKGRTSTKIDVDLIKKIN